MKPVTHECECPHPDCEASLKVKDSMQSGEYQCICKHCTVRLSWAAYIGQGLKPYLTLVERKGL